MADQPQGLDESERAELERLRAEKARRDEAARAAQERAELERLRAEQERVVADAAQDERIEEARRRMEPGDDLKMPTAQKIVLAVCAVLFVCAIFWVVLAPK